ncbi:MAG: phosphate signaling complex protein PhoU [Candidatus Methylomirabilis sp.]|nr:phosphate signaling complex protein PhoU [Deltaproteobacteria bacterium]
MTREAFHRALNEVQRELQEMSEMAGAALKAAMEGLKDRDLEKSRQVIRDDVLVNRKRFDIEEKCVRLIATQQPTAIDLRLLFSMLNIITDLERIGDHAEGIAKISVSIGESPLAKPLTDMPRMAEKARTMLCRCMEAFRDRDIEAARDICGEDDEVDALYDDIYNELILLMVQNPALIKDATFLIWASHNIERIADRVTNIAERVVYIATGRMEEMNTSKY